MRGPGFTASACIRNGQLFLRNVAGFQDLVRRLKDGDYELTVAAHAETRSQKQNAFYHAVIVATLADHWGLDHEDAHELIKQHCNPKIVNVINKETGEVEERTIAGSTAKLAKDEWGLFIERCQRWAAEEFNVILPDPDPEWRKDDAA